MIGWLIFAAYAAGWWFATVIGAREYAARHPRCHGECSTGYSWSDRKDCRRYCREGCWRLDPTPRLSTVLQAAACSLVWPLAAPIACAYLATQRAPQRASLVDDEYIARLERELGIGERP